MTPQRKFIDCHIHLCEWFDQSGKSFYEILDDLQQKTGAEKICVVASEYLDLGGVEQNILTALYKLHNPTAYANGCIVFPSAPVTMPLPDGMDALTQCEELMEIGIDGLKLLCKPDIEKLLALPINHSFYDEMFAKAEKDQTPILWHVADPESFWSPERQRSNGYGDGTYPSFEALFRQTFDVLKKHPRLAVTFAHFLFLSDRPEILESIFDHYENVSIDVTPGTEMYVNFSGDLPFYRAFFEKYADRILFGTDATVPIRADAEERIQSVYRAMVTGDTVPMGRARRPVQGLALPPGIADRVLRENFLQRWGKAPKPINRNALKAYIEKYAHMISHGETKKQILLAAKSLV